MRNFQRETVSTLSERRAVRSIGGSHGLENRQQKTALRRSGILSISVQLVSTSTISPSSVTTVTGAAVAVAAM
ncbi:hypothetical protein JOH51_004542 [Rhizobium leguminosarum]|nr:hypothetical protein [Rhizobium leguminosarum]